MSLFLFLPCVIKVSPTSFSCLFVFCALSMCPKNPRLLGTYTETGHTAQRVTSDTSSGGLKQGVRVWRVPLITMVRQHLVHGCSAWTGHIRRNHQQEFLVRSQLLSETGLYVNRQLSLYVHANFTRPHSSTHAMQKIRAEGRFLSGAANLTALCMFFAINTSEKTNGRTSGCFIPRKNAYKL